MRRRMRTYMRNGWHLVEVPRTNLYKVMDDSYFGNMRHYTEIRDWCRQTFAQGTWDSSINAESGADKRGYKRFFFQNERDKTMFLLKWLT